MFGGSLTVDHEGKSVDVDGFAKFQAFPRISGMPFRFYIAVHVLLANQFVNGIVTLHAVLVNGLRKRIDEALQLKIGDPSLDIATTSVGKAVLRLIIGEGN
jgi:hypothetical protein